MFLIVYLMLHRLLKKLEQNVTMKLENSYWNLRKM